MLDEAGEPPTIVTWHDGRDVYVYPGGDRFYVDDIEAMRAGAEERRKQPARPDDLDELQARLDQLRAEREV